MTYVGRFATTRTKLRAYLARKIRERGWEGQQEPDLIALAERLASRGFIDDAVYAESKARSLTGARLRPATGGRSAARRRASRKRTARALASTARAKR